MARLRVDRSGLIETDAVLVTRDQEGALFSGLNGVLAIDGASAEDLDGDVVLVDPAKQRIERLIRRSSGTNTLLVTERCDQLCIMCSQPPKKTHVDRFDLLEEACRLAPAKMLIGVSGGEPTLYKERLLTMIERTLAIRPDLSFHILTNGQHFEPSDFGRLSSPPFRHVSWGIPLYAADPALHDRIVGKAGAYDRVMTSFALLARAGGRIELRTVLLRDNLHALQELADFVVARLRFVEAWSIMQLEHIGFARNRWPELFVDHRQAFDAVACALDRALLHGVRAQLFNFPRCTVPEPYRHLAIASISDWKRKFAKACGDCRERTACSGFFEWHPEEEACMAAKPL